MSICLTCAKIQTCEKTYKRIHISQASESVYASSDVREISKSLGTTGVQQLMLSRAIQLFLSSSEIHQKPLGWLELCGSGRVVQSMPECRVSDKFQGQTGLSPYSKGLQGYLLSVAFLAFFTGRSPPASPMMRLSSSNGSTQRTH